MGLKRKKNIIILTLCMVTCYILYQLYFFLTITSEISDTNRVVPVLDHDSIKKLQHLRSDDDKFINENGIIRGVFFKNVREYRPDSNNEFKCRNSEKRIPFEYINDDYCDCEDGSDEPSTTACSNGIFYCDTQYQRTNVIFSVPSSKVNDGICDCCDGSDEWILEVKRKLLSQSSLKHFSYYVSKCPNVCKK